MTDVPEPARRAALAGLDARERTRSGGTHATVAIGLALVHGDTLDAAQLATMAHGASHPITAALLGGPEGRRWARARLGQTAAVTTPPISLPSAPTTTSPTTFGDGLKKSAPSLAARRARLRRLSASIARADRDLRRQLTAAIAVALAEGLRRAAIKAGVKANQIVQNRRSTTAAVQAAADARAAITAGRLTPAVLAAVGAHEQDLLDGAFGTLRTTAASLIVGAQVARRRAVAKYLDVDPDSLDWADAEEAHREGALAVLVGLIGNVARDRLSNPDVEAQYAVPGELPQFPSVPPSLVAQVVRASNGAPVVADPSQGVESVVGAQIEDAPNPLVSGAVATVEPETFLTMLWEHGGSPRAFEPHLVLDGAVFDDQNRTEIIGKSADDFPYGTDEYYPLDHSGCECTVWNNWDIPEG